MNQSNGCWYITVNYNTETFSANFSVQKLPNVMLPSSGSRVVYEYSTLDKIHKKRGPDFFIYTNGFSVDMPRMVGMRGIGGRTCRRRRVEVKGPVYACLRLCLPNSIRSATTHHLTETSKCLSVCSAAYYSCQQGRPMCLCVCVCVVLVWLYAVVRGGFGVKNQLQVSWLNFLINQRAEKKGACYNS